MLKVQFDLLNDLKKNKKTWLITGIAGFIGSNLLIKLLELNQKVIGVDNFFSGFQCNLNYVKKVVGLELFNNFTFCEKSILDMDFLLMAMKDVDYVLHHAAIGSVPYSFTNPSHVNEVNVQGTVNVYWAAYKNRVKKVIFASSSAVYGDDFSEIKQEEKIGAPLSPYAITKFMGEEYAKMFASQYKLNIVSLRYFNVYGLLQSMNGAYASVIPQWIKKILSKSSPLINGTGSSTRDFIYVEDIALINILVAINSLKGVCVLNCATGVQTSLNELANIYKKLLNEKSIEFIYGPSRRGDIAKSLGSTFLMEKYFGLKATISINEGIAKTFNWYLQNTQVQDVDKV